MQAGEEDDGLAQLLAQVALGDRDAFDRIYEATSHRLFPVALAMLGEGTEAEDALQDGFVNVWRRASSFRPGQSTVMAWLAVVVRNAAIDRRRRRRDTPTEDIYLERACERPDPEASLVGGSEAARLHGCIEALAEDERRPVRRAFFGAMSYAEVAKAEGVPEGTMKSRIRRALKNLKACLGGSEGPRAEAAQ